MVLVSVLVFVGDCEAEGAELEGGVADEDEDDVGDGAGLFDALLLPPLL